MKTLAAVSIGLVIAGAPAVAGAAEMKGMDHKSMQMDKKNATHKAVGVVKKLDSKAATVSLAHEPIKTLGWPAMTMTFKVQDSALLDKLGEGRKVEVEFEQRGKDYVITSAKAG